MNYLQIVGAKENNLKNVNLTIPHDKIVLFCGRSGSGKTSLLIDIIHNESQRNFFQLYSSYSRQFLEKIPPAKVDSVKNLRASVAVLQTRTVRNSKSTVGTFLNVMDNLKVLFVNFGVSVCPKCQTKFESQEPEVIASEILTKFKSDEFFIVCGLEENFESWEFVKTKALNAGFSRVWQDNQIKFVDEIRDISPPVFFVIERFVAPNVNVSYVREAIENAYTFFNNRVAIIHKNGVDFYYRNQLCKCGNSNSTRSQLVFDNFSSFSACKTCKGFGYRLYYDLAKLIDPDKPLLQGGLKFSAFPFFFEYTDKLYNSLKKLGINKNHRYSDISDDQRDWLLYDKKLGIFSFFKRLEKKSYKSHIRSIISRFRSEECCPDCGGSGLGELASSFTLDGFTLKELFNTEIEVLRKEFLPKLSKLSKISPEVDFVLKNLSEKINFVSDLNLGYLTLNRKLKSLSSGELKRLSIISSLGTPLCGLQIILDEPSTGLGKEDYALLSESLVRLKDRGNSVFLIEHDSNFLPIADYVVFLGPERGLDGGEIVFAGEKKQLTFDPFFAEFSRLQSAKINEFICLNGLSGNNISEESVKIVINALNVISGPSGSGKSTLLRLIYEKLNQQQKTAFLCEHKFTPKSSRSTVASYLGIWDKIRDEFSRRTGLAKKYFSFNSNNQGRCKKCAGLGYLVEDLQFLPSVKIICPECEGKRFNDFILNAKIDDLNIIDVLNLTVEELGEFLPELKDQVETVKFLGLGYLKLGQTLSELSVGEAQRLRLLRSLNKNNSKSFILFDEPTIGLHPKDVAELLNLISFLIYKGHTIVMVENDENLISRSHHLILMGPGAGPKGGKVIYQGKPKERKTKNLKEPSKSLKITRSELSKDHLHLFGCKNNNLKIDYLAIPYNKLVCFTGVSGAGKSSLVIDTIAAESQRLFLSNLSPYTLSFLELLPKPATGSLDNLKPVIFLPQYYAVSSKYHSVGTLTDILSYIRVLLAKEGKYVCPTHKVPLEEVDSVRINQSLQKFSSPIFLLGIAVSGRKGTHKELIEMICQSDLIGAFVDGLFFQKDKLQVLNLDKNRQHTIELVSAIFNSKNVPNELIENAIQLLKKFGCETIKVLDYHSKKFEIYSFKKSCPICGYGARKLDPEDLSYTSRRGRCQKCDGIGFTTEGECLECSGSGVSKEALNILLDGKNLADIMLMSIYDLKVFLENYFELNSSSKIVQSIQYEVMPRVDSLIELGLGYLSLNRRLSTLSSGELQRARLASLVNTTLTDILIILDEPTASLHPSEVELVMRKLNDQVKKGNSVFMIEHDRNAIQSSEYVIELGPGGGRNGGRVVFSGSLERYQMVSPIFSLDEEIDLPNYQPAMSHVVVSFSNVNNLKIRNLKLPLNRLVGICGKSGSGKSSLVHGTIYKAFEQPVCDKYRVELGDISEVVYVDQTLISKNSRSSPSTYLDIWRHIQSLFASTRDARYRGLKSTDFSFNARSSKLICKECLGTGIKKLKLGFLREERISCPACFGNRFNSQALNIRFRGLSIVDVANLTFSEAFEVFNDIKVVSRVLDEVIKAGLGYLKLGQPLSTLSGGENQRLKLLKNLLNKYVRKILFLLDEPTLGLHVFDMKNLIKVLRRLVDRGHSVFVIEHEEIILRHCDYIINLGPGAADEGGKVCFEGPSWEYFNLRKAAKRQKAS